MIRKLLGIASPVLLALVLLSVVSCGRDQQLVSIQIQPNAETFGASNVQVSLDQGLQVQLKAYGTYIHPPVTKDITSQVTWFSNDTQMMTVDSSGMLTATGQSCGTTLVSASVTTNKSSGGVGSTGAVVTGFMTGNVVCYTGSGGGGGNPAVTLTFQGTGSGSVASSPAGLSCASPGPCVSQSFSSGTTVTLTATPTAPASSATWPLCPSVNSNVCMVDVTGNTNLTVAFN